MEKITTGGPQRAPVYLIVGVPVSWSGKDAAALSADDIEAIKHFCDTEGWKVGYRDADGGQTAPDGRNPFHPQFLDAVPYRLWRLAYRRGFFAAPRRPLYCPVLA